MSDTRITDRAALLEQIHLAIAMDGWPPCSLAAEPDGCGASAQWVGFTVEQDPECPTPPAIPLCNQHKAVLAHITRMRNWPGMSPSPCDECGYPLYFESFEPLTQ